MPVLAAFASCLCLPPVLGPLSGPFACSSSFVLRAVPSALAQRAAFVQLLLCPACGPYRRAVLGCVCPCKVLTYALA